MGAMGTTLTVGTVHDENNGGVPHQLWEGGGAWWDYRGCTDCGHGALWD